MAALTILSKGQTPTEYLRFRWSGTAKKDGVSIAQITLKASEIGHQLKQRIQ